MIVNFMKNPYKCVIFCEGEIFYIPDLDEVLKRNVRPFEVGFYGKVKLLLSFVDISLKDRFLEKQRSALTVLTSKQLIGVRLKWITVV